MFIKNFGLFWQSDEVAWFPGKGAKGAFRLLGRQGKILPNLRLADFRYQRGIYILYGNCGPYYTGLTTEQGLGKRLRDHLEDDRQGRWNRFSWFGFQRVLNGVDGEGIQKLGKLASTQVGEPRKVIHDVEALLIRAMGLSDVGNIAQPQFSEADEWKQVQLHEMKNLLEKVG